MDFASGRRGLSQAKAYFTELSKDWEMVYFFADEFIAEKDRVVMVGRCAWRHKRTGKTAETPKVDIWRFEGDKATEVFELYDTARAIEATRGGSGQD